MKRSKQLTLKPLTFVSDTLATKVETLIGQSFDLLDEQFIDTTSLASDRDTSETISRAAVQLLDLLNDCDGVIIPFNKIIAEASWQLKLSKSHKQTIFIMIRSGEPELL